MLFVAQKVRRIAEEIDSAISVSQRLLTALESYTEGDRLNEEIGIFAQNAPKWRNLTEDRQSYLNFIRKVCTGEISISVAQDAIRKFISELEDTRRLIKL